jgi:hypothetical protein
MTILNRLYASGGPGRLIYTLQVSDGSENIYITNGWTDTTVTLEDSSEVKFTAVGMELSLPEKNDDGTQDLTFGLSNITGEVSNFLRQRIKSRTTMTLTLRIYTSDNLGAPAEPPSLFEVKGGEWDIMQATITAGYFNMLETNWPRRIMTLNEFPGLRYT